VIKIEDISTNKAERNYKQSFDLYGKSISRANLLPGHYYSFNLNIPNFNQGWIPSSREEWLNSPDSYITDKEYYDLNPVGPIFYHNNWKNVAIILNFKVIHPKYRPAIMNAHLNLIEQSLNSLNVFDQSSDIIGFEERAKLNLPMYRVTPDMLQELTGFKLNWAMSGYKLDKISSVKLMDWDKIGELPFSNIDSTGLMMASGKSDISELFYKFENKQRI
jgi:hypothetical protein